MPKPAARRFKLPREVYHLADMANWTRIQSEGLLCAHSLLHRANPTTAAAASETHRPHAFVLPDGTYIRDQGPCPPAALGRCLDPGIRPADWYAFLNGCVFFWTGLDRVQRHFQAQNGRPTVLIVLDAERLAARYAGSLFVTPFNIGNARRRPAPRGWRTLVPLERWRLDGWAAEAAPGASARSASAEPVELVIRQDVPDAMSFVVRHEWLASAGPPPPAL